MKKIVFGMLIVAGLCLLGALGYQFGSYLAQRDAPTAAAPAR